MSIIDKMEKQQSYILEEKIDNLHYVYYEGLNEFGGAINGNFNKDNIKMLLCELHDKEEILSTLCFEVE